MNAQPHLSVRLALLAAEGHVKPDIEESSLPIFNKEILIPLYNTELNEVFETDFGLPHFATPATFHSVDPSIKPIEIHIKNIHVVICPFDRNNSESMTFIEAYFPINEIESDFDRFDFHQAKAVAIFLIKESYPDNPLGFSSCQSTSSAHELSFLPAFCRALKLYDDSEPHYFHGYHAKDRKLVSLITTWPLKEMQGAKFRIAKNQFEEILSLCRNIWSFSSENKGSKALKVFNIASSYYLLTATQTEYNIIFIFLMIAFEALFKDADDQSITRAKSRFGKLVSQTKAEYNSISKFMSEEPNNPGCCYFRNAILHGDETFSSINSQTFWKLKSLIRMALISILNSVSSGLIDKHDYYKSIDAYVENRFRGLPNN